MPSNPAQSVYLVSDEEYASIMADRSETTTKQTELAVAVEDEPIEVPLAFFPTLPGVKLHRCGNLRFKSQPGMSQGDYERRFLLHGSNDDEDDTISIVCPIIPSGHRPRVYLTKRSTLCRAPAFLTFFESKHYRPGCNMTITLTHDQALCFEVVKNYLEDGPDRYGIGKIGDFANDHYKGSSVFDFLGRLASFAEKLGLAVLVHGVHRVIFQLEDNLEHLDLIILAHIFYEEGARFGPTLKKWIFRQLTNRFHEMNTSSMWATWLPTVNPDLRQDWTELVAKREEVKAKKGKKKVTFAEGADEEKMKKKRNGATVATSFEDDEEKAIDEAIKKYDDAVKKAAEAKDKMAPSTAKTDAKILEEIAKEEAERAKESDTEPHRIPSPDFKSTTKDDSKAHAILGYPSKCTDENPPRSSHDHKYAKARTIMGIDAGVKTGYVAGRIANMEGDEAKPKKLVSKRFHH